MRGAIKGLNLVEAMLSAVALVVDSLSKRVPIRLYVLASDLDVGASSSLHCQACAPRGRSATFLSQRSWW